MRFSSLSLQKYGHFEDCVLRFERGSTDFHLVFGHNEAGKSTTMSAVGDLLFGYPHLKTHDFRYEASFQRLAATLDTAGGTLFAKRRRTRGNRDSLLDEADAPVQDGALLAALHGLSREAFCQGFSLDHARLRQGGQAIVEARDDVGAALFEAGRGLPGAQRLLEKLQAEADSVWGDRKAQSKTYWQAERQREEAERSLKSARVLPRDWAARRDTLDQLQQRQTEAEGERSSLQAELNRLQRIRRLAPSVARRAALTVCADATPIFDAGHEALHGQIAQAVADAEIKRAAARAACEQAETARQAIAPDQVLLDQHDNINDLVSAAGAAAKAVQVDLPGLRDEMAGLQADVDRLTRDAGIAPASLDDLLAGLPPPMLLAALEAKATQRQTLQARLEEATDQLRREQTAHRDAASRLAGIPAPPSTQTTAAAMGEAQTAKAVAGRLPERQRAVAAAQRALDGAVRRLAPWSGTTDALDSLVLPGETETHAAELRAAEAEKALAEAARAAQDAAERQERIALERRHAASRRAISAEEIAQSRMAREQSWAGLRATLASGERPTETALAGYERLVSSADRLADERFETAEASARLLALSQDAEQAGLDARQARERHARTAEALALQQAQWQGTLTACGAPPLAPAAFRQWAANRLDAMGKAAALAQARQDEADDLTVVEQARARLLAVLGESLPTDAAFADLLETLQARSEAHSAAAAEHIKAVAMADAAQKAAQDAQARWTERTAHVERWHAEWQADVAGAGLPIDPATLPVLLPLFGQLRSTLEAAIKQQRRIAGIARDELAFGGAATRLASTCRITDAQLDPYALTEKLRQALQHALQDHRAAREAEAALAKWRAEQDKARLTIEAAQAKLAPLLALAGLSDHADLARAVETSRALRTARDERHALEQSILADSEGFPLGSVIAEVEAADLAALGAAVHAAGARIAALDTAIAATAQEVGQARADFATLNRGADAALAAADEQHARAAMAAEAETYLLKRTQAVMLKWAIAAYRRQQESPLLNRASTLFSMLTMGRYAKLDIDRAADKPRLVGHCANGRSAVGVDGMSDGTADQLFLALRLAALEQSLDAGIVLPFLADDLFINFDDQRAHAGFRVLGEVARRTQVLFFTHHDHLRAIAQDALGPHTVSVCDLAAAA